MERKHKFNSLTPEVLPENKAVYTEALDFAFSNNDIKNIAIRGSTSIRVTRGKLKKNRQCS